MASGRLAPGKAQCRAQALPNWSPPPLEGADTGTRNGWVPLVSPSPVPVVQTILGENTHGGRDSPHTILHPGPPCYAACRWALHVACALPPTAPHKPRGQDATLVAQAHPDLGCYRLSPEDIMCEVYMYVCGLTCSCQESTAVKDSHHGPPCHESSLPHLPGALRMPAGPGGDLLSPERRSAALLPPQPVHFPFEHPHPAHIVSSP